MEGNNSGKPDLLCGVERGDYVTAWVWDRDGASGLILFCLVCFFFGFFGVRVFVLRCRLKTTDLPKVKDFFSQASLPRAFPYYFLNTILKSQLYIQ